jgi:hypothetical protein
VELRARLQTTPCHRDLMDVPFPVKKTFGSTSDSVVNRRREELEHWSNEMLARCPADHALMTVAHMHLQEFFAPEDAVSALEGGGTPRTASTVARQSQVKLPSRVDDLDNGARHPFLEAPTAWPPKVGRCPPTFRGSEDALHSQPCRGS